MAGQKSQSGDLFSLLKQDHRKMMNLFSQLIDDEEMSSELFSQIQDGLDKHLKGEEEFLYPALEKESEARDLTLEAEEEHHVSKLVMGEISRMSMSDDHWLPKVKVLRELIDHHIHEEEEELFELAQEVLSEDQLLNIRSKIGQYIK